MSRLLTLHHFDYAVGRYISLERIFEETKEGYSLYEPVDMMDENKAIFRKVLSDFRKNFPFNPTLFEDPENEAPTP